MGPRQTSMSSRFNVISVDADILVKGKTHTNSKFLNATGMYNPRNVMKTSSMVAQRSREDNCVNGAHPTDWHVFSFYVGIFPFLANVGLCDLTLVIFFHQTLLFIIYIYDIQVSTKKLKPRYTAFSEKSSLLCFLKHAFFKRLMHFFLSDRPRCMPQKAEVLNMLPILKNLANQFFNFIGMQSTCHPVIGNIKSKDLWYIHSLV